MIFWIDGEPWEARIPSIENDKALCSCPGGLTGAWSNGRPLWPGSQSFLLRNPVVGVNGACAVKSQFGHIFTCLSSKSDEGIGLRLVLFPLDSKTLEWVPDRLVGVPENKPLLFGGLRFGDNVQDLGLNASVRYGVTPTFVRHPGLVHKNSVSLTDTPGEESKRVCFARVGGMLVALRNILANVSYDCASLWFGNADIPSLKQDSTVEAFEFIP